MIKHGYDHSPKQSITAQHPQQHKHVIGILLFLLHMYIYRTKRNYCSCRNQQWRELFETIWQEFISCTILSVTHCF